MCVATHARSYTRVPRQTDADIAVVIAPEVAAPAPAAAPVVIITEEDPTIEVNWDGHGAHHGYSGGDGGGGDGDDSSEGGSSNGGGGGGDGGYGHHHSYGYHQPSYGHHQPSYGYEEHSYGYEPVSYGYDDHYGYDDYGYDDGGMMGMMKRVMEAKMKKIEMIKAAIKKGFEGIMKAKEYDGPGYGYGYDDGYDSGYGHHDNGYGRKY